MGMLIPAYVDNTFVREGENPYSFDLDINGILALTPDNVARVRFLLENDSSYRSKPSDEEPQTVKAFCDQYPFFWDKTKKYDKPALELTERLVEIIDLANSTHQASEGPRGGNNGRKITAATICDIKNFEKRIRNFDPSLVDEIAKSIDNRYTFSFATKFCTYVSRALFPAAAEEKGYSIYDLVIRRALPYYAVVYLGEKTPMYKGECVKDPYSKYGDKDFAGDERWNYANFAKKISDIIDANERKTGYRISKENFDRLLWYYYKGEGSRLAKARKCISETNRELSRTNFTESDSCIIRASDWRRSDVNKLPARLANEHTLELLKWPR
ncbi:hypothetical protein [Anaerotardibacter muris]|uniref:hypothetical protein n=1 Tax=Anaerotardibacter muris TaxID=2941505 RepID=UPI00203C27DB|nr:hypothetical protein [Anaerotardibacter muris]